MGNLTLHCRNGSIGWGNGVDTTSYVDGTGDECDSIVGLEG